MEEFNFVNIKNTGLIIGFSGAHRTGKTSICQTIENTNPHLPFVKTNVSSSIKEKFGVDVNEVTDTLGFLEMQEYIIDALDALWSNYQYLCVTDRTPLDVMAYTAAKMNYVDYFDPQLNSRYNCIMDKCKAALKKHFGCIIHVQPGIAYIEQEGKPKVSESYQDIVDKLCIGYGLTNFLEFNILPRNCLTVEGRYDESIKIFNNFVHNVNESADRETKQ